MAKAVFAGGAGFYYHAEIVRLVAPEAHYSLTVTTTWSGAASPDAERRVLQVTTDAAGLQALAQLIQRVAA